MTSDPTVRELKISRLGARGGGIADIAGGRVYVPFAVPGDRIEAAVQGERGRMVRRIAAAPDRIPAYCPYFETCGGCSVQTLSRDAYAEWKRNLVAEALARAGLHPSVAPLVDAHGAGRRRATFHVRRIDGRPSVGFMRAQTHDLVEISACPLLAPALADALRASRRIAEVLAPADRPLDIVVTAADEGLDMDLRGAGALGERLRLAAGEVAREMNLARLANHGDILIELAPPRLRFGPAAAILPPGAFIQATAAGEAALWDVARESIVGASRAADLFAGVGAFSLRAAETARVHAVDCEAPALAALDRAARETPGLRQTTIETRDLFRRPLDAAELSAFDVVLFDPPRAGAQAQAEALARSHVEKVVAISCAPTTLARDLAILVAGGYVIDKVVPIDQFRESHHVEAAALLRKPARRRKARPLG